MGIDLPVYGGKSMLADFDLVSVNPLDIPDAAPLPYDVYSAEGALLFTAGQTPQIPEQVAIMRATGWCETMKPVAGALNHPGSVRTEEPGANQHAVAVPCLPLRERPSLDQTEVLIAEDMKLARDLLIRMLNDHGITRISWASNGHSAITHFFQHRPHLVFLDIYMPPSNGFDVLQQIKAWCPGNFVCMVSGDCTQANAEQARKQGVNAFIIKPISPLNLKRVLAMYGNH